MDTTSRGRRGKNSRREYAYVMKKESSIDIDDEFDFEIAQYLIKIRGKEND